MFLVVLYLWRLTSWPIDRVIPRRDDLKKGEGGVTNSTWRGEREGGGAAGHAWHAGQNSRATQGFRLEMNGRPPVVVLCCVVFFRVLERGVGRNGHSRAREGKRETTQRETETERDETNLVAPLPVPTWCFLEKRSLSLEREHETSLLSLVSCQAQSFGVVFVWYFSFLSIFW